MASGDSAGLGYTSRKTTPRGANFSFRRRISGAYRFEIGQSTLMKRNTIARVSAAVSNGSTSRLSRSGRRSKGADGADGWSAKAADTARSSHVRRSSRGARSMDQPDLSLARFSAADPLQPLTDLSGKHVIPAGTGARQRLLRGLHGHRASAPRNGRSRLDQVRL